MKKSLVPKLAALAGVAALSVSSVSAQDSGVYTKLEAGVSFINGLSVFGYGTTFKTGFATNGIVGFNLHQNFGLELEGGYAINTLKTAGGYDAYLLGLGDIDVSAWTGFGNLILRTNLGESLSVFAGGGPGFAVVTLEVPALGSGSEAVFAGQAKAGISFRVSEQISLDLTYRARFLDSPVSGLSSGVNQQITGGISIGF
jgi:opacity protein-like surface antigen